jgi:hypothetical protein
VEGLPDYLRLTFQEQPLGLVPKVTEGVLRRKSTFDTSEAPLTRINSETVEDSWT